MSELELIPNDNGYDRLSLICAALTGLVSQAQFSPEIVAKQAITQADAVLGLLEEEDEIR